MYANTSLPTSLRSKLRPSRKSQTSIMHGRRLSITKSGSRSKIRPASVRTKTSGYSNDTASSHSTSQPKEAQEMGLRVCQVYEEEVIYIHI